MQIAQQKCKRKIKWKGQCGVVELPWIKFLNITQKKTRNESEKCLS